MSIDSSTHSLFGVSKAAGDLLTQEYGRYFDMPTVCFRAGCLTGPNHAGAQAHGFLSYLMRCTIARRRTRSSATAASRFETTSTAPTWWRRSPPSTRAARAAAVYNLGGGRFSNCSVLEAIAMCEEIAERRLDWTLSDRARIGDHRWWISDLAAFERDYPGWTPRYDVAASLREIHDANCERWSAV